MRPKITQFDSINGRYFWTVEYDGILTDERVAVHYHTNRNGEGLWKGDCQTLGTCQFSLPSDAKRARARIYDWFVRNREDWGDLKYTPRQ